MRRLKLAEAIGPEAMALMQAAPTVHSSAIFRQSNEFFYVTGVGVPQAMLVIDGATKKSTLYLAKQDASRAAVEGALLSSDDAASAVALTGIDEVKPVDSCRATWPLATRKAGVICSCRSSRPKAAPRAATGPPGGTTTPPRIRGTAAFPARRTCVCC